MENFDGLIRFDHKFDQKEQLKINNTDEFQQALAAGLLDEAIDWLDRVKFDDRYDETWLDHRSHEVFEALCSVGRLDEAAEYIKYAQDEAGQAGRQAKIERLRKE